ncbi:LLM class flavin-dependent oxidoreductase [Christiangramia flava]|uniref:Luciferase-like monooxygenase n=1 Tax=Christiangramia flava JLT2011 TaxID=1229726 RepID=A0A1L7I101_9FLAO|nr:LLM class flavin-dependent oxidoreductase [Christiangramia flava]APU66762.1 Luciferase-like monooxygenase [Christiangramia flava JLT2011]OSS38399.1 luciferase-like monooxygenase [Christiangramia flava JLT2011]
MQQKVDFSVLELAVVGEGISLQKVFQNSLELANLAESLGYTRFWLAEHHNMKSIASSATAILIDYIANGTKSIRVGSGGIMLPNHSPLIVAEQFGTLGALYPGRIDLGLGRAPGTDQITAQAIRSDRMNSVYQFPHEIEEIRRYFTNTRETTKVRATVAEGVEMPFYILGSSTDSAHLAAAKGLPYVFASHFAPNQLFQALEIYRSEFQPSEYLSEPYTIAGINVIVADTDAEAERLSTSSLRMILGVLSQNPDYLQEPEDFNEDYAYLKMQPAVQQMMKYAFFGSPASVRDKTEAFLKDTGVNELIVTSHIYHQEDRLKSYRLFAEIMKEINAVPAS